jgi:hypothetical protein
MGGGERERLVYALRPWIRSHQEPVSPARSHERPAHPCQNQKRTRTAALPGSLSMRLSHGLGRPSRALRRRRQRLASRVAGRRLSGTLGWRSSLITSSGSAAWTSSTRSPVRFLTTRQFNKVATGQGALSRQDRAGLERQAGVLRRWGSSGSRQAAPQRVEPGPVRLACGVLRLRQGGGGDSRHATRHLRGVSVTTEGGGLVCRIKVALVHELTQPLSDQRACRYRSPGRRRKDRSITGSIAGRRDRLLDRLTA